MLLPIAADLRSLTSVMQNAAKTKRKDLRRGHCANSLIAGTNHRYVSAGAKYQNCAKNNRYNAIKNDNSIAPRSDRFSFIITKMKTLWFVFGLHVDLAQKRAG